ncbi:MAG: DUF1648 domain-containing protein [Candidatus Woesearchaeota archaeon]|jgi:uncharacterized membrane protein
MQKSTKISIVIIVILILLSFAIGIYSYQKLPDKVASHWDANGNVNGYMGKFWGIFLMPIISVFMVLLFLFLPTIDPMKNNVAKFRTYFDYFIVCIIAFFFYIYILTIVWNFGFIFDMLVMMIPALSILFFFIGILLEKSKRNWFIGIRTPWTLSSDKVWDKTHKLGAKLFKLCAIISLIGIFVPKYSIFIFIVPLLVVSVFLMVYSYIVYKKDNSSKK